MVIVGLNIKMDGALGYKFESFCVYYSWLQVLCSL